MTHHVYRCYDAAGQLLYIGCTGDIESRMAAHRSSSTNLASGYLRHHMDRYTLEPCPDENSARRVEREAIAAEAPLVNVHYNGGRGLPRVLPVAARGPVVTSGPVAAKLDAWFGGAA